MFQNHTVQYGTSSYMWVFDTWHLASTTEKWILNLTVSDLNLNLNGYMWLKLPSLVVKAPQFAHHFCHILLLEASHKTSTDSREWRNVLDLFMPEATMSLCGRVWTLRARIGGGERGGIGNILCKWSERVSQRPCCVKKGLKRGRPRERKVQRPWGKSKCVQFRGCCC